MSDFNVACRREVRYIDEEAYLLGVDVHGGMNENANIAAFAEGSKQDVEELVKQLQQYGDHTVSLAGMGLWLRERSSSAQRLSHKLQRGFTRRRRPRRAVCSE